MLLRTLVILLALSTPVLAEELRGEVVGIADGDTLTLLTPDRRQVRVRLAEIDAPERRQPYGDRARQELSGLAFRQQVRVVVVDTDRYGRTIGRVHAGRTDVSLEMVRRGAAWAYPRYVTDPAIPRAEQGARRGRQGLWALPGPVPPWEWRRP